MAQIYHKLGKQRQASNAAYDSMDIVQKLGDEEAEKTCRRIMADIGVVMFVPGMMQAIQAGAMPTAIEGLGGGGVESAVVDVKQKGLNPEDVMQQVQALARESIGFDEGLYVDSPLMDSGMDSLTAVSFRNGLQQTLAVKLPSSLMFDYPTMKEVANRIVELSNEQS